MTIKTNESIKSLQDFLDTLEKGRIADDLLREIFFAHQNDTCVHHMCEETYRKLQKYFNINEDE